jgi:YesN/AraC family two-component response regulator
MNVSFEKLKTDENSLFLFGEYLKYRLDSPFHYHDEVELIYIKKGRGKLYVGESTTHFSDNECYLLAPGLAHCFYNATHKEERQEKAHVFLLHFDSHFLGKDFLNKHEGKPLKKLFTKASQGIRFNNLPEETLERFMQMGKHKGFEGATNLLSIINDLIKHKNIQMLTASVCFKDVESNVSKNILDVYQYVYNNFQKEITFSSAASIANMQKSAFCRYFKRKALKNFSTFVNEVRIKHAQKLIAETDLSITDICYNSGFNNLTYFNKQFQFFLKTAPSRYKKQLVM